MARLPWISTPQTFTEDCTRCGKCISQCDTQIIVQGDGGFPTIDFTLDECTFCYRCADACPEPIFNPKDEEPWSAKAKISQACLATKNVECRTCGEACDSMAIKFTLSLGQVAQPSITTNDCTGCGACVSVCPTTAITVSN